MKGLIYSLRILCSPPLCSFFLSVFLFFFIVPRSSSAQSLSGGGVTLVPVLSGFINPVLLTTAGDGSGRLFIVEQSGRIRIVQNGITLPQSFLDLRRQIHFGGEQGLLSLAFHPQYAQNGRFFVYLNDRQGNVSVWAYKVSRDPNRADTRSRRVLLNIPHRRFSNHNGGTLAFGPDGMLYVSTGDGGGGGDPLGSGQSLGSRLGKILRINVNSGRSNYLIPADNPFVSLRNARREIWAYGLRNPWRFSFDRSTGRLFVGDVGQNAREEVDIVTKGGNYGWNTMEGSLCYSPSSGCNQTGLILPIAEYPHEGPQSITGGFVYRGSFLPSFVGQYFFADFISGKLWTLSESSGIWTKNLLLESGLNISSFGEDESGELYLLDYTGNIFRIIPSS